MLLRETLRTSKRLKLKMSANVSKSNRVFAIRSRNSFIGLNKKRREDVRLIKTNRGFKAPEENVPRASLEP